MHIPRFPPDPEEWVPGRPFREPPLPRWMWNPWIPMEKRLELEKKYGAWAVSRAEGLVPESVGIEGVEKAAQRMLAVLARRYGFTYPVVTPPARKEKPERRKAEVEEEVEEEEVIPPPLKEVAPPPGEVGAPRGAPRVVKSISPEQEEKLVWLAVDALLEGTVQATEETLARHIQEWAKMKEPEGIGLRISIDLARSIAKRAIGIYARGRLRKKVTATLRTDQEIYLIERALDALVSGEVKPEEVDKIQDIIARASVEKYETSLGSVQLGLLAKAAIEEFKRRRRE